MSRVDPERSTRDKVQSEHGAQSRHRTHYGFMVLVLWPTQEDQVIQITEAGSLQLCRSRTASSDGVLQRLLSASCSFKTSDEHADLLVRQQNSPDENVT